MTRKHEEHEVNFVDENTRVDGESVTLLTYIKMKIMH